MPSESISSVKRAVLLIFLQQAPSLTDNNTDAYQRTDKATSVCNFTAGHWQISIHLFRMTAHATEHMVGHLVLAEIASKVV